MKKLTRRIMIIALNVILLAANVLGMSSSSDELDSFKDWVSTFFFTFEIGG
jgi:hypothetical protein